MAQGWGTGHKDAYSEAGLETALIKRLEDFPLELGSDFTFCWPPTQIAG
jgi:predicted nuclease of restriction endonuclease-like (RecB) superfamily